MLRLIVWLLLVFIAVVVVRMVRLAITWKQQTGPHDEHSGGEAPPIPPFSDVQEADFEDITPKNPGE